MNASQTIVITGLRGGSGKTIVSLAIASLLRSEGRSVTTFKKGPDYIDAGWLARAAGSPCYNLDLFMMTPEQAHASFIRRSNRQGLSLIEGNRGLFDGVDAGGTFSTAELAKLLKAPVVIVIDCTKTTSTVAALVLGCMKMDEDVNIAGVVLNRIATPRQEKVIREAVSRKCGVPVLGAVPRLKKDPFPERHMGLTPFQEHGEISDSIGIVKDIALEYLDMDGIVRAASSAGKLPAEAQEVDESDEYHIEPGEEAPKIGIIRDSAFQFYYEENLEALRDRGAQLVDVSPLTMKSLPDINALYIGGGFPETHAIALAENTDFKNSLLGSVKRGLPVYAECGGLMYLGNSIELDGNRYPMTGILPVSFALDKRPAAHGYTIVEVIRENPFYPVDTVLKGHEFHYSRVIDREEADSYMAFKVKRGKGIRNNEDGMCCYNVFATYTHLHAVGMPQWADGMISAASRFKLKHS